MPKVMLIEDNASLRDLMAFLLQMEGFEVVFGPTRPEAIPAALHREQPEVAILDVHLKDRRATGLEVLRTVRQDEALQGVRLLLISGMDYSREAAQMGADAFLSKPFMGDELIAKVRSLAQAPPSAT